MRRRELIARLGSAAGLPIAAWYFLKETHAQQSDRVRNLSIEILSLKAETAAGRIRQDFLDGFSADTSKMMQAAASAPLESWWSGGRGPMLVIQGLADVVALPENGRSLRLTIPNA
jgi:pimeloyl-ACP methyl ester carboxylesterase